MDIDLLKTFLAVEKTGHFGQAAESLYLTPAAVSSRIRHLESLAGGPLFLRIRSGVVLTPSGERFKPYAETIIEQWNRALQESSFAVDNRERLALGGTPNLWDVALQAYLNKLREAFPNITLRAECHDSQFLIAQLQARRLDMALMFDVLKLDELSQEHLYDEELIMVSSVQNTSLDTALSENYIQVDWSVGFTLQHRKLLNRAAQPALITSAGRIALDCLLTQGGAAYLPGTIASPYLTEERLFPVQDADPISQGVYAIYRLDNARKPLVEKVTALLRKSSRNAARAKHS
jgi:DNA-binding transcriptional LysR family regulator